MTAPEPDATAPLAAVATRAAETLKAERRSTATRVSETLRDSITRGELPPGTQLREHALADMLDISRNTVREALRLLDHEGLVDYHVHRGVTVRRLSASDVHDLYRTREAVQLAAISYAGEASLEPLRAVVDDAEVAAAAGDWKTVATLDIVFHQKIVALVGSERLDEFFQRIVAELRLVFAAIQPTEHARFVTWNRKLVDLLEAGKLEECANEMRAYLASAEEMIQTALMSES